MQAFAKVSLRATLATAVATGVGIGFATSANAADISRLCEVDQVGVMGNRIHIKCAPIAEKAYTKDIPYYAMSLDEKPAKIDAVIALATTAKQIRKPLVIWFDWDDYKSVPGCQGSDCRAMRGVALE